MKASEPPLPAFPLGPPVGSGKNRLAVRHDWLDRDPEFGEWQPAPYAVERAD